MRQGNYSSSAYNAYQNCDDKLHNGIIFQDNQDFSFIMVIFPLL